MSNQVRYTVVDGVAFVEGYVPPVRSIGSIQTEINNFLTQNQLKTLDDLQKKMSQIVRKNGGNAVLNFQYGQRSSFWKSLFGRDDVYWYGSGQMVVLNPQDLE